LPLLSLSLMGDPFPLRSVRSPSQRGTVHRLRLHPQGVRQGSAASPPHHTPEVGNALPGPRDRLLLPAARALFLGYAYVLANTVDEACQGETFGRASFLRLELTSKPLYEHARAKDPGVPRVGFLPPTEILDRHPSSETPHKPAALEIGPVTLALPFGNKLPIRGAGTAGCRSEPAEYLLCVLPEALACSDQRRVSAPRILAKRLEVGDDRGADRVHMNVADEF